MPISSMTSLPRVRSLPPKWWLRSIGTPPLNSPAQSSAGPRASLDLLDRARLAVDRVFRESELRDIWQDAGSVDKWDMAIQELQGRLSG